MPTPGYTTAMHFVMVRFAWEFLRLSRAGVKIVQTAFAHDIKEIVVGK